MAVSTIDPNGLNIGQIGGTRNKIINGAMTIDQRNAGAAVTINTAQNIYVVDRWSGFGDASDGVFTMEQSSVSPAGFTNSLLATVTTADASVGAGQLYLSARQKIEGFNFASLSWGTASAQAVTLSFWVRSSLTGTFGGSLTNGDQNRSYPFAYTISAANTWEYKTIAIEGDTSGTWLTTNGVGADLFFSIGTGSTYSGTAGAWAGATYYSVTGATNLISTLNATWYVTGVQLEAGDTATPFEHRSYGAELALCQRYFQRYDNENSAYRWFGFGYSSSSTSASIGVSLKQEMRSIPTVTTTAASGFIVDTYTGASTISAFSSSFNSRHIVRIFVTCSGIAANWPIVLGSDGNSDLRALYFSAEL
jgi:hypothetical protein